MSNSPLVNYVKISPNKNSPRNHKIDTITIHHMAGNLSVETCGNLFASPSRQASANYGVGSDGRVGMYVEEKDRSWCSSNGDNDHRAVTIEVANDQIGGNWHVSDTALEKLIELCADICKRNGIAKLNYTGDTKGNLTMHKWFAATACPGPYLESKFPYIAEQVNQRLGGSGGSAEKPETAALYRVQCGAFSKRGNAQAMEKQLQAKGYSTYLVQADGLYKVQTGAFLVKANADNLCGKLKKDGFSAFVTTQGGQAVSGDAIQVGDRVKVKSGAKTYDGKNLASFVYQNTYDVQQLSGDRAVIGQKGVVTAAVKVKDLIPA
ncbi:N-acetylmuramoyl-L-alanine amidase [Zongyangia sp. HA2173]|uniref:N-acetylmuramoyl-L-alanine amidase n=1 Tax=Zongyangia sp. HA2173 TaxID=3133035 RepID=UPI003164DD88